jgi:hypothetical protein
MNQTPIPEYVGQPAARDRGTPLSLLGRFAVSFGPRDRADRPAPDELWPLVDPHSRRRLSCREALRLSADAEIPHRVFAFHHSPHAW